MYAPHGGTGLYPTPNPGEPHWIRLRRTCVGGRASRILLYNKSWRVGLDLELMQGLELVTGFRSEKEGQERLCWEPGVAPFPVPVEASAA